MAISTGEMELMTRVSVFRQMELQLLLIPHVPKLAIRVDRLSPVPFENVPHVGPRTRCGNPQTKSPRRKTRSTHLSRKLTMQWPMSSCGLPQRGSDKEIARSRQNGEQRFRDTRRVSGNQVFKRRCEINTVSYPLELEKIRTDAHVPEAGRNDHTLRVVG